MGAEGYAVGIGDGWTVDVSALLVSASGASSVYQLQGLGVAMKWLTVGVIAGWLVAFFFAWMTGLLT